MLAPTIHQASCQQQLSESAREVSAAVDDVVRTARSASQASHDTPDMSENDIRGISSAVMDVEDAATEVRTSLDRLNAHLLRGSIRVRSISIFGEFFHFLLEKYLLFTIFSAAISRRHIRPIPTGLRCSSTRDRWCETSRSCQTFIAGYRPDDH